MRRIICIVTCLGMASIASALSITNGDFETYTVNGKTSNADIADWYDYGSPSLSTYYQGPFQYQGGSAAIADGGCMFSGIEANEDEDGGNHAYVYQSIGINDPNIPAVDIELDWGIINSTSSLVSNGEMGVTVMILESDGTFEPNEWDGAAHDIYGFLKTDEKPDLPITEIGRGTAFGYFEVGDPAKHERFQIDLASATPGNELFLRVNGYKGDVSPWVGVDNITLSPAYVLNQSPEDGAVYIDAHRTSAENDLVFKVTDPVIAAVDVLFSKDPNLPYPDSVIEPNLATPGVGLYTVDLEALAQDLDWSKEYYWKVIAYESDGGGGLSLKYTSMPTSFKTIQYGPLLKDVTPSIQGVWPGEDAEFKLEYYNKTDTFQWYKEGDPDVELSNGAKYAGVDSNTLTIFNCQTTDEGHYYCKGWYTEAGPTVVESQSTASGELAIKELKSYYPFTENNSGYTPDVVGGKNAQLMGGASLDDTDPIGTFGSYLVLDNPRNLADPQSPTHTQYADIADDSVAHHKEITISCWVKPRIYDPDYEQYARIFAFGTKNTLPVKDEYFYLTLFQGTNRARCEMAFNNGDNYQNNDLDGRSDAIGYGTHWLYVVLTIEDGFNDDGDPTTTGKIYINGEFTGGGGLYNPSLIDKTENYIGKAVLTPPSDVYPVWSVYPYFDGFIDELKIYNYAKTAEEIAKEYMAVRTDVEFVCNMDDYDLDDWDYDGSCQVDLPDLAEIAEHWLVNYFIYPN